MKKLLSILTAITLLSSIPAPLIAMTSSSCNKEYCEKNKEKLLKKQKKEYYEKNKEKIREQQRKYYEKNKEKLLKKQKEYWPKWYQKNKPSTVRENNKNQQILEEKERKQKTLILFK
ncbi:hypothetical protein GL982_11020 (plasmid) [Spiroplasma citri]|uniref:hypothetical protein n=1 Tax=Spiroplasma citri TaxID=2133 RepID=UPI0013A09835|nr:hypothetical protein [Spiroplasma citri]QIA74075.1 hypothetical protein GL982_11020 [Spiroplasma citri]